MKLKKIIIENYKSIDKIEFDIKKYGDSYTTMLLGINESGKSNVLQAMSFLNTPDSDEEFDYYSIHNQKDEKYNPVNLWYFMCFEKNDICLHELREKITNGKYLDFEIEKIVKNVYLQKDDVIFSENYGFEIRLLSRKLFIKKQLENNIINGKTVVINTFEIEKENDSNETYEELTEELFREYFENTIISIIKQHEPRASFWTPSSEYLISEVDLNEFKENTDSNIPLRHIFALSGYETEESIIDEINNIPNGTSRRRLMSSLGEKTTKYITSIWKHEIKIDIEITENGKCNVLIQDEGVRNEHYFHKMDARSEGFKQFISLILSLSIETKKLKGKNKLILIDEPESHLHPSGIRDLCKELLEIGRNNYLFISTHSPFLVDKKNKERNIIIKKNKSALTEKKEIKKYEDINGDEVLDEAFGINVYKDLMNRHKILVEGYSENVIFKKAFQIKQCEYGVTNGTGSNIVQIASKFNHDDIDILIITDDDRDGKEYRDKILLIGGKYNNNNVFTIRDLVGSIKSEGTIEDLLGEKFVESCFKKLFKSKFKEDCKMVFDNSPFINQIKNFLHKEAKYDDSIMEEIKKKLSDDFRPSKTNFNKEYPLLDAIVDAISEKLQESL